MGVGVLLSGKRRLTDKQVLWLKKILTTLFWAKSNKFEKLEPKELYYTIGNLFVEKDNDIEKKVNEYLEKWDY